MNPVSVRAAARLLVVGEGDLGALAKGLDVLTADEYLEGRKAALARDAVVVNLCRSFAYLSKGYYVSLLADARGQRAYPTLEMIEQVTNPFAYFQALREAGLDTIDFKILRGRARLLPKVIVPENGRATILESGSGQDRRAASYRAADLRYVEELAVFGRCSDRRFQRAAKKVFSVYAFPSLRIRFYEEDGEWKVGQIFPVSPAQLDAEDKTRLAERLASRDLRKGAAPAERRLPEGAAPRMPSADCRLALVPGAQIAHFSGASLYRAFNMAWQVDNRADRMGVRLSGPVLRCALRGMVSEGIPLGAVQVPADGQPIVLLNDRQTIGGYPRLGALTPSACASLAQCLPGTEVRLVAQGPDQAQEAHLRQLAVWKT